MTAHLLALTVGPVQEFISAARRTRDLWFGSYMLSEISRATARTVRDQGGKLIFPAPGFDVDLIANVILAELHWPHPMAVARAAREAAKARWRGFADKVFEDHQAEIDIDIWKDQVDYVIEFYAAWVSHTPETYRADRANLMRLLAGRKRCRDFKPAQGRAGVRKSSLDGLRESVLGTPGPSRRRMRLQNGEQLDVIGMVKRTWAPSKQTPRFPSVARVAADPWLRGIGPTRLNELFSACEKLGGDVLHQIDTSSERGHPHYAAFPFEGTAVFRFRHRDLSKETDSESDLDPLAQALTPLARDFGEPTPYLAMLVADGDRVGRALSFLDSADDHREFSQTLAGFASEARQIVHEHNGILVYAGGDDVLAFVPVDRSLRCARALHDRFGDTLATWAMKTETELTLSVGLAIAHFMEPLEDLLDYGRTAEGHAKRPRAEDRGQKPRNGLAVHLLKRGGGPVTIRANWSDNPDEHVQTLAEWIGAGAVSSRVAYDFRKIADVYDTWPANTATTNAIQRDTLSVMKGKQPLGESRMRELGNFIRKRVAGPNTLRRLGSELLIARQLAQAIVLAGGGSAAGERSA